ncbi:uncharacterized protein BX664DRAFT_329025 [Halteromyces radiatus]|uniref:uncharacterized protein n=1 Tax=Halteromyces radiatus TaxID=101107 RepID=UPI00221FDA4E|nr:uncharacterized protein BX664DRAFT_329025 [Halteromyces radiatus]KAI8093143.1 hypothetical protein BX664DRAFT_329025 [Halteromyces radiatus]
MIIEQEGKEEEEGNMNQTKQSKVLSMEERRRAMKVRKRIKKKLRKQRDKLSIHKKIMNCTTTDGQLLNDQNEHQLPLENEGKHNQNKDPLQDQIDYIIPEIDLTPMAKFGQNTVDQFSNIIKRFELPSNNKHYEEPVEEIHVSCDKDYVSENDTSTSSKKKRKKAQQYTLDELKMLATVPKVVEIWDTTAPDPLLLVDLKSYRNTVPVPGHWRQKQKYLYQDLSEDKPPFELPEFIKDTGIMEVRDNLKKQEQKKRQKTKKREQRRPKLGKMDLEYQALHDAFFRFQTKPHLTLHGDLYFERKEIKSAFQNKKPGQLSDELKEALGMSSSPTIPPPWLLQMQRYGPPPSYPYLKIPGLNTPIPEGAQWGLQKNGWGLVPVDAFNRPLYGDVFNTDNSFTEKTTKDVQVDVDRTLWGALEEEEEEEEIESEESEEDNNDNDVPAIADQPIETMDTAIVAPIDMDVGAELKTGKQKALSSIKSNNGSLLKLYDIIPSRPTTEISTLMMGSQHVYDIPSSAVTTSQPKKYIGQTSWSKTEDVIISLDPSELTDNHGGLDKATLQEKYQQAQQEHMPQGVGDQELKVMYTDHAKRQAKKKRQLEIRNIDKKKDFKF